MENFCNLTENGFLMERRENMSGFKSYGDLTQQQAKKLLEELFSKKPHTGQPENNIVAVHYKGAPGKTRLIISENNKGKQFIPSPKQDFGPR
jgi:hypothetical protein